jgi:2-haloacid dehalogenase
LTGPHPQITTVVFDIGGVLLEWDPRNLYGRLFDDEAEMERFLREVCTPDWHAAHDRGVPAEESCARLAAAHPDQSELIFAWARRSEEMIVGPIEGTVEILRELKQTGVACYALTNMEAETYPQRLRRYPFMSWFEGTVVSSSEGVIKPDAAIFRRLLTRFGLDPHATVMIDDSAQNLATAASLGMTPIEFRGPERLRERLVELGLLPRRPVRRC